MASLLPEESSELTSGGLQLRRWSDPAIIAIAFIALASGFGQYGAVAALGDVSKQLGHVAPGGSIADKVGLSGTSLGVGLAIIRLASLGSLPLIGIADRLGRRRVILVVTIAGLALTVVAAASPGYWWFVAIFAFGRPLLSATNALAGVMSAEETGARDRSAAVALVAAGYGVGAGLSAIVHSLASSTLGFRGIFALALVPLVGVYVARRWVEEPSRFMVAEAAADHPTPVWGAVGARFRGACDRPGRDRVRHLGRDRARQQLRLPLRPRRPAPAGVGHGGDRGGVRSERPARAAGRAMVGGPRRSPADGHRRPRRHRVHGSVRLHGIRYRMGPRLYPRRVRRRSPRTLRRCAAHRVVSHVGPGLGHRLVVTAGVLGAVVGLVAFGAVADVGNRFAAAGELVFLPAAAAAALFWLLPETKGREPESLWPDAEEPGRGYE